MNNISGKYRITYQMFNILLKENHWLLRKWLKDNWTPDDHLDYIDNIYYHNSKDIEFCADAVSAQSIHTIDVYIKSAEYERSTISKIHHIQFIKDVKNEEGHSKIYK